MDPGLGKVVQSPGMVEIEMREHDVAHVLGIEAEPLDLADGGHLLAELRTHQCQEERTQAPPRIGHVAQAEPGVHQHQASAPR